MLLKKMLLVALLTVFFPMLGCGASEDPSVERYEGLEVGQTAAFSSGMDVTLKAASLMIPPEPQTKSGPRGEVKRIRIGKAPIHRSPSK